MPGGFLALAPENLRPRRLLLRDFSGRAFSLADNAASWELLNPQSSAPAALVLGLGPGTFQPPQSKRIYWFDDPEILAQTSVKAPAAWEKVTPDQAEKLAKDCKIYFYKPNMRLNPGLWGPLIARFGWIHAGPLRPKPDVAWLPGNDTQLLHQELYEGLRTSGFENINTICPGPDARSLEAVWNHERPALALSVNFRGLDPEGRIFGLCREACVPLAIWLVDNPWNVLSMIPLPWWKEAMIFITDPGFVGPLRAYGAKEVHFLPLAAAGHMWGGSASAQGRPIFVGRTAFPDQKRFFSGLELDSGLKGQAIRLLNSPCLPDFHWWEEKLHLPLWPGKEGRLVSFGADFCSTLRRRLWVETAQLSSLEIIGDAGWQTLLPGCALHPPVDYYGALPTLYRNAICTLNVTSLLLPSSLNQRHFDVWAAGGFLLSDSTPGLELFPKELTAPITLETPAEFASRLEQLEEKPSFRKELIREWQTCIRSEHTYSARIRQIQKILEEAM